MRLSPAPLDAGALDQIGHTTHRQCSMENKEDLEPNSSFKNNKGALIYRKVWPVKDGKQPRAIILICHGLAEHCMRYANVVAALNEMDFLVYGHDHVGHGRSDGVRVDVLDFDQYVDDVIQHIDIILKEAPPAPLFLVGHSMGGLIAARSALRLPREGFGGVVFIAGAFASNPVTASAFMIFFAKIIARLSPQLHVAKLPLDNLSRDEAIVEDYIKDPLVYHDGVKARWAVQTLTAASDFQDKMATVTYPCLILQGDKDKLVMPSGANLLYNRAASKDKELKIYEGFYHQLHAEPGEDGKRVIKDIIDWLLTRS